MMDLPVKPFNLGIGPIACHSWNADRTQIALSPNNREIHIYTWRGGRWDRSHILDEHDLPVTGIDWGSKTNRIVTCSQDKNAFVWTFDGKVWKPELVLVRLNRAATCVRWSPLENKFAVGSGAKLISVCYYEKENDWWVSKHIRKPIKSTITSLDWHRNNVLLAVASCDFKTRVFSAYVKEVDDKPSPTPWGSKMPLGQLMTEYSNGGGGWVHDVKFSPAGSRLAWVGHDSSVSVVDAGAGSENITTVKDWYLPFTTLCWVTENSLVAGGHDCCPMLFCYNGPGKLEFVSKLDIPSERKAATFSALNKFKSMDTRAAENGASSSDASLKTLHQNTITQIAIHSGAADSVTKFSTSGIDGLLVLWDLQDLAKKVSTIRVA